MNTKITLGNTLNALALLKLEHDELRSLEDRRHADADHASARDAHGDRNIVAFESAGNVFSKLADGFGKAARIEDTSAEATSKLDRIAGLLEHGAEGASLVAGLVGDLKTQNAEVQAVLASIPEAQGRAEFLTLLDRLGAVLTNQKPANG